MTSPRSHLRLSRAARLVDPYREGRWALVDGLGAAGAGLVLLGLPALSARAVG